VPVLPPCAGVSELQWETDVGAEEEGQERWTQRHVRITLRHRRIGPRIALAVTNTERIGWWSMSIPYRSGLDTEAILNDLSASRVSASICWLADGRIDVKLGDPLNGYDAEATLDTLAEAAEWLQGKILMHYPRSVFSRKYAGSDHAPVKIGTRWSEMDLVDLGHMLTRELPIKEIASHLRRSPAEVRDKIAELGRACKDDRSRHYHSERRLALAEH
jgi:hypothetical protein